MLRLDGIRVLLVEDEYYIADDIRQALKRAGAEVVGPVATLDKAQAALDDGSFDCAIVDLNLHGQSAVPIAERLLKQGRSFAIATGYGSLAVPDSLKDVPRVEKPFDPTKIVQLLEQLGCARTPGAAVR
jgi:DNA-binding NtrC family response regulator